jgi:alkylmercury lyase
MTQENIEQVANRLVKYYRTIVSDDRWELVLHTVRELAKGEPVEPARLAELMNEPVEEIKKELESVVEWDDEGRVVGHGLTLVPTQHEFEVDGRTIWVWCAGDAIIFPAWIDQPARIKSPCAVTGEMIEVFVTPDAVKEVTPAGAAASVITHDPRVSGMADVRAAICSGQVFFKSEEVAKELQEEHPNSLILPVSDYFEMYKHVHEQLWASNE